MKNPPYFLFLILFSFNFQNILSSSTEFLHFSQKSDCPNSKISSLGILISLSEQEESSYESTLTEEERESYESIISLKHSFSSTLSTIPQSFSPEKETYWKSLDNLMLIFVIISIFPMIFILFYLIMRFACKKCTGPRKIKHVNKIYRNVTWATMIIFSIATLVLFSIIISKSNKVQKNVKNSFNFAVEKISKSDNTFTNINQAVINFNNSNPSFPLPNEEYMNKFKNNINKYIEDTKSRTQQILDDENKRDNINIAIFSVYLIIMISAYVFFFLKKEFLELAVSIILFFAVPGLIILEGFNAKFFFYYGDICDSVNTALYSNEFPVAGKSLGYYYNCFPTDTKSTLYNIRYKLYENVNSEGELYNTYKKVNEETFEPVFNCDIVNSVLPNIEREFCKDSLDYMYSIVSLLTWTLLTALGVAIGSRRLQTLIWKKKMEIEEMIENREAII